MSQHPTDLTLMLSAASRGDAAAAEALLPAVYDELRRLAVFLMAKEKPGQTLQPTALVHEAYMKIAGTGAAPSFEDRKHFFNAAANAMRRILIDRHRRVHRDKHGGGAAKHDLDALDIPATREFAPREIEHLDGLLDELASHNARWGEIVHLRYFIGLTIEQTAEVLGISIATVKSDWAFARAWLKTRLSQLKAETD